MNNSVTYFYFYGSGTDPNRKIDFFFDEGNIRAEVSAFREGVWTPPIAVVPGDRIIVEMQSTSEKVQAIMKARNTGTSPKFDNQPITSIKNPQTQILSRLAPKGPWRIEIENDVGGPDGYEKVLTLQLFNPS